MKPLGISDPRRIDRFVLDGRLGSGGMGTVYRGRTPGHHLVAVKVIHRHLADDEGFRRRFASEVRCARKVRGLYTAAVVDADPDPAPGPDPAEPALPWLATEFVSGVALEDRIQAVRRGRSPALSSGELHVLAGGLAEALVDIHGGGTVHRDLKPSNILLADTGPRVIDFGIAQAVDAMRMTHTGLVVGSAHYVAPERFSGDPAGEPSDIFSLGVVLAYAATGRLPFADGEQAHGEVRQAILYQEPDLRGLTGELRDVVLRCLTRSPRERPTARQMLDLLGRHPAVVPDPRAASSSRVVPDRRIGPSPDAVGDPDQTRTVAPVAGPTVVEQWTVASPEREPATPARGPGSGPPGGNLLDPVAVAVAVLLGVVAATATTVLAIQPDRRTSLLVAVVVAVTCLSVTAVTSALGNRRAATDAR